MMLHKAEQNELNSKDLWGDDALDRKRVADYLTPIVASVNQPFVISLSSSYGTGKTFFVERWRHDLNDQGFKTAYFNAWESDFSSDVISAFISSLERQFASDDKPEIKEKFIELTKRTGGFLRHKALPLLIKGIGRKIVGEDGVKETIESFDIEGAEVADLLSSAAVEALSSQKASEEAMVAFKDYLKELAIELSVPSDGEEPDPQKQKLIIFVDELDRCRPDYAIEVLEHIKHLFAVDGVVFVLSIDEDQLKSTIASVYGAGLDADGYLRRFIDWGFMLPEPSHKAYTVSLIKRFGLDKMPEYNSMKEALERRFHPFCEAYNVSLRKMGQAFTPMNMSLRYALAKKIFPRWTSMIPLLIGLKVACPELYYNIQNGDVTYRSIFNELIEKLKRKNKFPPVTRTWEEFHFILQALVMSPAQRSEFYEEFHPMSEDVYLRIKAGKLENNSDEAEEVRRMKLLAKHISDDIYNQSDAQFIIEMIEGAAEYHG